MSKVLRQLKTLCYLPREPGRITTSELRRKLELEGFLITPRTLQRDLESLSAAFPIGCEEQGRSLAWYFYRDATLFAIPAMDAHTAFTFLMSKQYLTELLPKTYDQHLQPYYDAAQAVLGKGSDLSRWTNKVRIVPRGQPLLRAEIKPEVLYSVHEALLHDKYLQVQYRTRQNSRYREYEINPLGLVLRYEASYLICTLWNYQEVKHFALHRCRRARVLDQATRIPPGFKLDDYVQQGPFNYPVGGMIKLEALFDADAARHLRETPLSPHQCLRDHADGRIHLTVQTQDTAQLRWWLLGFGAGVEVLAPQSLREEFMNTACRMNRLYQADTWQDNI